MNVAILHDEVSPTARPDELDALVQADVIAAALARLGHQSFRLGLTLDLNHAREQIKHGKADLVFNLVESIEGQGRLVHLATALLDAMHVPYTGAATEALFLTADKLLTKRILQLHGVPTPPWYALQHVEDAAVAFPGRFMVKSVWEEASVGLDDDSLVAPADENALRAAILGRLDRLGGAAFAEQFIEGREFNLSVLENAGRPQVLPPAEIVFEDYPAGKPRIVGYQAKWQADSFEYNHTPRRFDFPASDGPLLSELYRLAERCWTVLGLEGYVRVDFRVDEAGRPWVLEINANPCLSPDAGFAAAADRAGMTFDEVISRILAAAARPCAIPPPAP